MDIFSLSLLDIVDIFLVAVILYQLYLLIRGSAAMYIFVAVAAIYIFWITARSLGMELIATLLGQIIGVGMLALVIVFQQEIRQFLLYIGNRYIAIINQKYDRKSTGDIAYIDEIVVAAENMSSNLVGALIVFTRKNSLSNVVTSGDVIDAKSSQRLIETIFFKNSPLHDGAMIVTSGHIRAARCLLPSSEKTDIPASMGMRHRAAIGISEQTDAIVVVVSEQTGRISYIEGGKITTSLTGVKLKEKLVNALNSSPVNDNF